MPKLIAADVIRQILDYDPETGVFTWLKSQGRAMAGDVAGSEHTAGYIRIKVLGESYVAHRLAVLVMTGKWPEKNVPHLNGEPADNRWVNLQDGSNIGSAHCWRA